MVVVDDLFDGGRTPFSREAHGVVRLAVQFVHVEFGAHHSRAGESAIREVRVLVPEPGRESARVAASHDDGLALRMAGLFGRFFWTVWRKTAMSARAFSTVR